MNLPLTKLNELLRFPPTSIAICIFIFITVMSLAKSCENSSDNGFRVEHSARMGGGLVRSYWDTLDNGKVLLKYDTTKPKTQQKITVNRYVLIGNDTLFQVLWLQCTSPADVTPRNLQKLQSWLQQNIRQDTTAKQ